MCTVDVGHEMHLEAFVVRFQSLCHHKWPQVRTSDTNVYDVGNLFARITKLNH